MSKFQALDLGLVVRGHGRHYIVEDADGQRFVCHPRGKKSDAVVGDQVRFAESGDEGVIEDLGRGIAASEQDLGPLDDLLFHPVVQIVVHLLDELLVGQGVEVDVLVIVGHVVRSGPWWWGGGSVRGGSTSWNRAV